MKIAGLQKLTLLDFPGKTACTVFTGGCNFRCPFCHNATLVQSDKPVETMDETAFWQYLEKRRGVLDGVCVTGGEPLLQPDMADFLQEIKRRGLQTKLDTNGSYPERLRALLQDGLVDYVAMDIKNCPEKYGETVGRPELDMTPLYESVALLREGTVPFEFRTTVVREFHTAQDLAAIGRWLSGTTAPYFLQSFVDSGDLLKPGLSGYTPAEMKELLAAVTPYLPQAALRGV